MIFYLEDGVMNCILNKFKNYVNIEHVIINYMKKKKLVPNSFKITRIDILKNF